MNDPGAEDRRDLFVRLAKGSVKSLPVIGALADEIIFGTLDDRKARAESRKLHAKIDHLVTSAEQERASARSLLVQLSQLCMGMQEVQAALRDIGSAMNARPEEIIAEELTPAANALLHEATCKADLIDRLARTHVDKLKKLVLLLPGARPHVSLSDTPAGIANSLVEFAISLDESEIIGLNILRRTYEHL